MPSSANSPSVSVSRSVMTAALLVLAAPVAAGLNAGIAYLTVGLPKAVPIVSGVVLCFAFVLAVGLLHRAAWLALLAVVPAVLVLVGSVQLAPEAVLETRGVRHEVVIVDEEVTGKRHEFTLEGDDGVLGEPLVYQGSDPGYRVGDELTVIVDPDGAVGMADAGRVDPSAKLAMLAGGTAGWAVIALLAGWRGHVRRRAGRTDSPLADLLGSV